MAPKQGHWGLPCPHPVLAPKAPKPHPSMALTLVFPSLEWHGPYFCWVGLFLDYARGPLINLHAWWAVEKVSAPGKCTELSHLPSSLQPRLCLSTGPSFLPYMRPSLCIRFPFLGLP